MEAFRALTTRLLMVAPEVVKERQKVFDQNRKRRFENPNLAKKSKIRTWKVIEPLGTQPVVQRREQ